ncbi:MAG TPA: c-type cytochrome [Xanthobacteraceae bacterium]|nr:c-type cytochrome [Xanthobacteraceae bacterium]
MGFASLNPSYGTAVQTRAMPLVGWARFALPTLHVLTALLAAAPLAAIAQSIADKAQPCAGCHGEAGIPPDKSWPVIWGQQQGYLYLQLRDFKSGARKDDIMGPIAQALERDDMLALALYFSQKPWPNLGQPRASEAVATQAARANGSVGCTGCHQAGYRGEGTQPRLAGQEADYILKSMMDFRTHARGNNPGMSALMNATSEDDLKALAQYLAGL